MIFILVVPKIKNVTILNMIDNELISYPVGLKIIAVINLRLLRDKRLNLDFKFLKNVVRS